MRRKAFPWPGDFYAGATQKEPGDCNDAGSDGDYDPGRQTGRKSVEKRNREGESDALSTQRPKRSRRSKKSTGDSEEFKRSSQDSDSARKALIEKTKAMVVVTCKREYINAGKGSADSKFQKILAESIAGMPTPNEAGPWDEKAKQYVEKDVPAYQAGSKASSLWDDSAWERAQQCAMSMEKYFGVKLHKLHQDRTHWMGTAYSNPQDLDRNGVFLVCQERLSRLRLKCNKKWETNDTVETLYREILFLYCCSMTTKPELQPLRRKYGDRLGLPLVLWKFSPLRFSVAHRTHGFSMFTGWATDALDVKERIENDEQNNMLIESWYVNCGKLDMAEEYYAGLDEILSAAIITDKSVYDPATPPSAHGAVPTTENIELNDDYIGATFADSTMASMDDDEAAGPDDGEEAPDVGAPEGQEDQKGEASGVFNAPQDVDPDEAHPHLQTAIKDVYEIIMADENLRTWLVIDRSLTRTLGLLQRIANGQEAGDAYERFQVCMGQIYENWINPARGM